MPTVSTVASGFATSFPASGGALQGQVTGIWRGATAAVTVTRTAPLSGTYGLRVLGLEPVYDLDPTPTASTSCGLAWQTLAVPEPSTLILMAIAAAVPAAGIVREACGRRRTDLRRVVD